MSLSPFPVDEEKAPEMNEGEVGLYVGLKNCCTVRLPLDGDRDSNTVLNTEKRGTISFHLSTEELSAQHDSRYEHHPHCPRTIDHTYLGGTPHSPQCQDPPKSYPGERTPLVALGFSFVS